MPTCGPTRRDGRIGFAYSSDMNLVVAGPARAPAAGRRWIHLAAADLELTATDLDEIETASAAITLRGGRYPQAMERLIDR